MEQIEAFLEGLLGSLSSVPGLEAAGSVALFLTAAVALISKLAIYAVPVYIFGKMMRRPKFEPRKIITVILLGAVTPVVFGFLAQLGPYINFGFWSGALVGTPWYYFFFRPRLIRRYAKRAARSAGRTVAKLR